MLRSDLEYRNRKKPLRGVCATALICALVLSIPLPAASQSAESGVAETLQRDAIHAQTAEAIGKSGKKKKKKKKKKGPHSSVSVNPNGARVKVAGEGGAVSVGRNGPSVSVRPNGGPVRIGIGPNGKPKFSYHFRGGR
ncbi:MAG: hypothetical protein AB3N11_17700 [Arenibacterium sp.]